ncbi:unnamed protein product [Onchocerca flexuosa]|uniref:Uncharacterized protein n=1 Tax=Onchocerca flexuosa TaxID=387005 RepID=A0A183I2H2_9BILA|nr:unnamed protein product [Onchocerca flexuosa]
MQNPFVYTNHSESDSFDLVPIIEAEQLAKEINDAENNDLADSLPLIALILFFKLFCSM